MKGDARVGASAQLERAVHEWLADNRSRTVDLLRKLVRVPSYSGEEGTGSNPSSLQGQLFALACAHGTDVERQQVAPGSENVIETLHGVGRGALVIDAHTDVVSEGDPERWFPVGPFAGAEGVIEHLGGTRVRIEVEGAVEERHLRDRMAKVWEKRPSRRRRILYGRGSFDNKGAVVALLLAMEALAEATRSRGVALGGSVIAAYSVDEEAGETGVRALASGAGSWLGRRGLLDGPTGEDALLQDVWGIALDGSYGWVPVVGHRGAVQIVVSSQGRSTHAATPHLGINAVTAMSQLLSALSDGEDDLVKRLSAFLDPALLGLPTVAGGTTIVGGGIRSVSLDQGDVRVDRSSINTVPDWCQATIDVRFPPSYGPSLDETGQSIIETMEGFLAERVNPDGWSYTVRQIEGTLGPPVAMARTFDEAAAHPLVQAAFRRGEQVLGHPVHLETAPGGTNATRMTHEGRIPTLVEFGPAGGLSHDVHEFVEIDSVVEGAEIMALMAIDLLGVKEPD